MQDHFALHATAQQHTLGMLSQCPAWPLAARSGPPAQQEQRSPVYMAAAEEEDVVIISDHAIDQALGVQPGALRVM